MLCCRLCVMPHFGLINVLFLKQKHFFLLLCLSILCLGQPMACACFHFLGSPTTRLGAARPHASFTGKKRSLNLVLINVLGNSSRSDIVINFLYFCVKKTHFEQIDQYNKHLQSSYIYLIKFTALLLLNIC